MSFRRSSVSDSNITADEFSEEGRSADGGLRNGDLLIPQKCEATILPTASYEPENLSPCGFGSTFWRQKVEIRNLFLKKSLPPQEIPTLIPFARNDVFIFQALACIFGGVAHESAPPPPAAEDRFLSNSSPNIGEVPIGWRGIIKF